MATTKTIFGYVSADRSETSGSSDFTVGQKVESGRYTIIFDPDSFNNRPIVVANCQEYQTDRGISIHIVQINEGQVELVVMNTSNQTPYDIAFNFIAIGTTGG